MPHCESEQDIIVRNHTQIFDGLPDMQKLFQAQRIIKLRQQCDACIKLGVESPSSTKLMLAYLVELQNRLESKAMKQSSLYVKKMGLNTQLTGMRIIWELIYPRKGE